MSGALNAAGIFPATVTLSGEDITDASAVAACTAGVRVNTDGTIDKNERGVYSQIDTATDWIRPVGRASSGYQVRITNVVWTEGSSFDVEAAAEDTWIALSANREWNVTDADASALGDKSVAFDIEIRKGSTGTADATGAYSLIALYETL